MSQRLRLIAVSFLNARPITYGIERGLVPPEPSRKNPARMTPDEQARCGIRPLPATLREALANLEADPILYAGLGDLLARCIVAVRTNEADVLDTKTTDEVRAVVLRAF